MPIIILTGDIGTETLKSMAESPYAQVVKPVMPEILLAQISDLMLTARAKKARTERRTEASDMIVHVVDDDPMIRETKRRLFEAEGWIVVTHASAEDFLAAPRPEGDACLLVDNLLPGIDGVALIAHLRAEESQLPAVMRTGHGDAAMAVAALKGRASDLIEKPASAAELLVSVQHAIETAEDVHAQAESHKAAEKRFADLTARERGFWRVSSPARPTKSSPPIWGSTSARSKTIARRLCARPARPPFQRWSGWRLPPTRTARKRYGAGGGKRRPFGCRPCRASAQLQRSVETFAPPKAYEGAVPPRS